MSSTALEPSPYQWDGAKFLAANPHCGLFDEPGAGKTCQVVTALDLKGIKDGIVVICPAIARANWCAEFHLWQKLDRRCIAAKDIHDVVAWRKGRRDVLVISFEQARTWADLLKEDIIEALVIDEAHYLKNPASQRTKIILGENCDRRGGIAGMAGTLWQLTGTPLPNDAADAWTFLRSSGAIDLDRADYIRRYFKSYARTYGSRQVPRPELLNELKYLHKSRSIRRTLAEVGHQLPPMRISTVDIEGDTQEIRTMLRQHPGLEKQILEAVDMGGLSFLDTQHIGTLRRLVAEAKSVPVGEWVASELEGGLDKVVIMGLHISALENLHRYLNNKGFKAFLVNGSVSDKQRQEAIKAFQTDSSARVFIANITSAGTALTLTAARRMIMLEADWSPANNYQALKRIHRRGQTESCLIQFVRLLDSVDEQVQRTIAEKTRHIASLDISSVVEPEAA